MGCNCDKNKGDKFQQKDSSIFKQVFNFGKAVAKYVNSGLEDVSLNEYDRRLSICSECEYVNEVFDKCLMCGCKITIKAKWATEKCPHPDSNKWN